MNISEFCIRRPVFTILLMAAFLVAGISGYKNLPVSALPNVDFPTISVSATLAGASPETMASAVATPLERQFSTIPGISSMNSSSYLGNTQITLQFDLDRNIDGAALDVQTAISAASRKLPQEMTTPPSFKKSNPADQPVLYIAVSSDTLPISKVNEYADTLLAQRISTLKGVAQVQIFGEQKYAIRVKLDPDKLATQNLSFGELKSSLAAAASSAPVGVISGSKQLYNIKIAGQPEEAAGFRDLVAVWKNGSAIRVSDIADVSDDVEDDRSVAYLDGKRAIMLAIQRQPDANTVDVVKSIKTLLPSFKTQLPASIQIIPMFDRSTSIKDSVHDVQLTLLLTIVIVILVIYAFVNNVRATFIPSLAVPLSIITTYGVMAAFGFSINNISLLALTLCVGFVVDDAIVMLENIIRYIEEGMKPFDAAIKGAKEIGFTIISITFSLVAVFIPVLFMGGVVGRIFYEFAVTISATILISGFVSLTLTPMLCSKILKRESEHKKPSLFERLFQKVLNKYKGALEFCLRHQFFVLLITLSTVVLSAVLFSISPKGFFPVEDTGFISGQTEAAQDISYEAMLEKQKRIMAIAKEDPAVTNAFYAVGGNRGTINSGRFFLSLKPRSERDDMDAIMQRLRQKTSMVEGIRFFMQPVQNIQIGGRQSKSLYQYTLQGTDLDALYKWSEKITAKISEDKRFADVTSDLQMKSLQALISVDQEKAASLGVDYNTIRGALYDAFGSAQIASLYTPTNDYAIIMEVNDDFKKNPEDIEKLYIKSSNGSMVRMDSFANVSRGTGPLSVNHQGQLPSVTISFNLAKGFSLSQAVDEIHKVQEELKVPDSMVGSFQGSAQIFQSSAEGQGMLIILSVLVIYIILGMLYESFIHPVTILSGLPSAGIGAIISLMLVGMDISVIAIIGIILLIGIVKKNSIMMVDFAIAARAAGKSAHDAIFEACTLRFRPIMMTTMCAIFGTLPIALGLGAGAELRQPLGIAVVGGLLTSQLLTLFITPVIYLYMERLSIRLKGNKVKEA